MPILSIRIPEDLRRMNQIKSVNWSEAVRRAIFGGCTDMDSYTSGFMLR